jgi:pimeloyl-ACP methyl ester carboxylesterase
MRHVVDVAGSAVEYEITAGNPSLPPLVFLHEGLGSIDLWRGFPDQVRSDVGDRTTVVYSRHGHGGSDPVELPRPPTYMHREADVVLPELLARLGTGPPILIGHSDGASIALLFAGAGNPVEAIVCLAPHVFVEPESIAGIERARRTFETSDMGERMRRYHRDPVATFRGWNDVWLSAGFRDWDITDRLPGITAPVLLVQGDADQYGTFAQLDAIRRGVRGPVDELRLEGAGHSPHLDARDAVVAAIARFVRERTVSAG